MPLVLLSFAGLFGYSFYRAVTRPYEPSGHWIHELMPYAFLLAIGFCLLGALGTAMTPPEYW